MRSRMQVCKLSVFCITGGAILMTVVQGELDRVISRIHIVTEQQAT